MGTSNHDYGGVGMGAGARPSVPGKLFAKFDFRIRQNHVLEPRFRGEVCVEVCIENPPVTQRAHAAAYKPPLTQRAHAARRRTRGGVWWVRGGYGYDSGGGPGG